MARLPSGLGIRIFPGPSATLYTIIPMENVFPATASSMRRGGFQKRLHSVEKRGKKPDCIHCRLAHGVASIQAVDNTIDRIDNDEQHLKRQKTEKQTGKQLIIGGRLFQVQDLLFIQFTRLYYTAKQI